MRRLYLALVSALLLLDATVVAAAEPGSRGRAEIWLSVSNWPSLQAIRPAAGGQFDSTGFGLGGALYIPLRQFEQSELLWGIDGFIAATDSNIGGVFADLLARQLYVGGALRWALGERRNVFLDAGLGYHLIDMTEVSEDLFGPEREVWEASRLGAYVGASWDIPRRDPTRPGRWMLGLRTHLADFGTVYGSGPLGPDAGSLRGPLYLMQIGYGVR